MKIRYIQDYMAWKGYVIGHSSIIHGINEVKKNIELDTDYKNICQELS